MSRCIAKERARAAAERPALERRLYELLTSRLPQFHHPLLGYPAILAFLHSLGTRRPNGGFLTPVQLKRWRQHQRFPLVTGYANITGRRYKTPAFTTDHAVVAWLLSIDPRSNTLFRVESPPVEQAAEVVSPRRSAAA